MTTLSEAFDHLVYWLFAGIVGSPAEPRVRFPALRALDFPPLRIDAPRAMPGWSFDEAVAATERFAKLVDIPLGQVCGYGRPELSADEAGRLLNALAQPFELADNESFLDPISGRAWIWTAGEFIRTPDADVPPAGER